MRRWQCGRLEIPLDRPVVMGIVNVTPDSFSDGGLHNAPADAVAYGLRLFGQGAEILDVGGESTRPGARGISASEELARVRPVVTRLAAGNIPVSIDTRHAEVARACVES
ncbi:dihydropteroate synthase, partial [bacterium]|nr:dihydropteroate synthase [bacterium]